MYDYRPPRQNAFARLLVLGFLLASVASFVTSALISAYKTIPQAIGLILLVPCIQIVTRYIVTQHLYRVATYEDGNADLEVYLYKGGSKMQLVCRVGLEEIKAVTPLGEQNKKPPQGLRRYNYAPDIAPKDAVVLSVANGDGDCEVLICPDEKILSMIASYKPVDPTTTEA